MATPAENVQTLLAYWDHANKYRDNAVYRAGEGPRRLYTAAMAMTELVAQCAANPYTRQTVWAESPIFSRALFNESTGYTDWLLKNSGQLGNNVISATAQAMFSKFDNKPPRLIMLEGIHKAATGGFFSASDPSGIASWLQATLIGSTLGGGGLAHAIGNDGHPYVRAAALKIVRDLAIPVIWLDVLLGAPGAVPGADRAQDGAIFKLKAELPVSGWDWATRVTLSALSDQAIARCLQIIKDQTTNTLMAYDVAGGTWPMSSPPAKRWYKRGDLLSAGAIGIMFGAAAHKRSTTGS
jgi:hypothetical protein